MCSINKYFLNTTWLFLLLVIISGSGSAQSLAWDELWIANGTVRSILPVDNTIYIGGSFTEVGPCVGNGFVINSETGERYVNNPKVNQTVRAVESDGAGGWYIGGIFDRVGGMSHVGVAHVLSDGTVDENFNVNVNTGFGVYALELDNSVNPPLLYIGGTFSYCNGMSRKKIAAVDALTGDVIPTFLSYLSSDVRAIKVHGGKLYVATGYGVRALDRFTGSIFPEWSANSSSNVNALAAKDSYLFAGSGGEFSRGGVGYGNFVVADTFTGTFQSFPNKFSIGITCVEVYDTMLYIGTASYPTRTAHVYAYHAKMLNMIWHQSTTNYNYSYKVYALACSVTGDTLFAGGEFVWSSRGDLTAFNAHTGTILPTSYPKINCNTHSIVYALAAGSDNLYIGGEIMTVNQKSKYGLAAIDATTGEATNWAPALGRGTSASGADVYDLAVHGSQLYAVGFFDHVSGISRKYAAAFDMMTGVMTSWNPDLRESFSVNPRAEVVEAIDNLIYIGGRFTTSIGQRGLISVDPITGSLSNWNPNMNDGVYEIYPTPTRIYVGGKFTSVFGQPRYCLAAFDRADGGLLPWAPNISPDPSGWYPINAIDSYGPMMIVGGDFRYVNGQSRYDIAAVDTINGDLFPNWNASFTGQVDVTSNILDFEKFGSTLYVGGQGFNNVNGQTRYNLAALNIADGSIQNWAPDPIVSSGSSHDLVSDIDVWDNKILVGGYFINVEYDSGYQYRPNIIALTPSEWNLPPTLFDVPSIVTIDEMVPYSFTARATDPDLPAQPLTFSLADAPPGAWIDPASGVFTWNPDENQGPGNYTFIVRVSDGTAIDEETITFTVNEVNVSPILADVPSSITTNELSSITFDANAVDTDIPEQILGFSLIDAPQNASIEPSTGIFSWSPTEEQGPGTYILKVRVTDGLSFTETPVLITINEVNIAPTITGVPENISGNELTLITFDANAGDPDIPLQTLTFSLVEAPEYAAIDPSTGIFGWTPTELQGPGTYSFKVKVFDGAVAVESQIIIIVNEVNVPPVLSDVPASIDADELTLITFNANATDADVPVQTLVFSLVDFPEGAVMDPEGGVFTWTPNELQCPESYTFKVKVYDGVTAVETPITISVNEVNSPPVISDVPSEVTVDELALLTFDANATDPDIPVQTLIFSLVNAPQYAEINETTGEFTWTPTELQGPGTYEFNVKVTDGVAFVESPVKIVVNEVNMAPSLTEVPPEITADEQTMISFDANASDPDVPIQVLSFSLVGAPSGAFIDPSTGIFTWNPAEDQGPAVYAFNVRVSDGVTYTEAPITINVNEVNLPPSSITGVPATLTADELSMIMFDADGYDPDIPIQTLTYSLINAPAGGMMDPFSGVFMWTPTEEQGPGTYSFSVRVSDGLSYLDAPVTITVNEVNIPPVLGDIVAPVDPIPVNLSINASAPFAEYDIPVGSHTATWYWGDYTNSAGIIEYAGQGGVIQGSHSYTSAGVYTIILTLTDNGGAMVQTSYYYVVVYDPTGGFVTGGGWINSPAGAYRLDLSLTGKATFGFVAKYLKGANVPTGNTEFQYKAGSLNFKSTEYEWLVIAGAKAKYKGTGTINQSGNYGFMLTGIDGQMDEGGGIDKFRIKIWDKNNGDALVYDNQYGEDDTSSAATVLGGGSIVIHKSGGSAQTAIRDGDAEILSLPDKYGLDQNYPNPFNPVTTIEYRLPVDSRVSLRVFNIIGEEVVTLIDGIESAGFKSISFNGSGLASGLYIYRLTAEAMNQETGKSFTQTFKMVLVK